MVSLILGFVLGLVLGSFIDCIAARAILGESFWGRSYCEHCKHKLSWYDLFPIFSFLFLRGKCRYCHKKIGTQYLLIEILMGLLIGLLFLTSLPDNLANLNIYLLIQTLGELFFKVFVVCVLLIVFLTDLKTGLIYDRITYPAIVITLVYLVANILFNTYVLYTSIKNSFVGDYLLKHTDYFY